MLASSLTIDMAEVPYIQINLLTPLEKHILILPQDGPLLDICMQLKPLW